MRRIVSLSALLVLSVLVLSMAASVNLGKTAAIPGRFSIVPMFNAKPPKYVADTVTPVAFGEADGGFALIAFTSLEKHRENVTVNGAYDPKEGMYKDVDNSGAVSIGDVRLNGITGGFAAGSTVAGGNGDIGGSLIGFVTPPSTPPEKHMENIAANGEYNPGEYVYRDVGNSGTVNSVDFRLTDVFYLTADLRIDFVGNLNTYQAVISWNPSVLAITTSGGVNEPNPGWFNAQGVLSTLPVASIDNLAGRVTIGSAIVGGGSVSGGGVAANILFLVKRLATTSGLAGSGNQLIDPAFKLMPSEWLVVDAFVLAKVALYWGTSNPAGDLNKDGVVDAVDLAFMATYFGYAGAVSTYL